MTVAPKIALRLQFLARVVRKECQHLITTDQRLFGGFFTLEQATRLEDDPDLAERVEAFVGRFGRLQDHISEKLIPRFAVLLGGVPKSLLDILVYAEKAGWINNAEEFVGARKLRNLLVHEYMAEAELFLESLQAADAATHMLIDVVTKIKQQTTMLGIKPNNPLDVGCASARQSD